MPTVPNLYGLTVAEAEAAWLAAGFTSSISVYAAAKSDTMDVGDVKHQYHIPGTTLAAGTATQVITVSGSFPDPPTPVVVPIVAQIELSNGTQIPGFTRWNALVALIDLDFDVVERFQYVKLQGLTPAVPAGTVVYTSPPAETPSVAYDTGTTVILCTSLGVAQGGRLVMPDIRGILHQGLITAYGELVSTSPFLLSTYRAGLSRLRRGYARSDTLPNNGIKAQYPAPGYVFTDPESKYAQFAIVNAAYDPAAYLAVTDVVDWNVWSAVLRLSYSPQHWEPVVTRAYHPTVPLDAVISQSLGPDDGPQQQGSTVTLLVSDGPDTTVVEVPDVIGETEENAVAALEDSAIGLVANVVSIFSSTVESGLVIVTDPVSGVLVSIGSTVKVFVSKGEAPALLDKFTAYLTDGNEAGDCLGGAISAVPYYSYVANITENKMPWIRVLAVGYGEGVESFTVETTEDLTGIRLRVRVNGIEAVGVAVLLSSLSGEPFTVLHAFDKIYFVKVVVDINAIPSPVLPATITFTPVLRLNGPVGHGGSEAEDREESGGVVRYSSLAFIPMASMDLVRVQTSGLCTGFAVAGAGSLFEPPIIQTLPDAYTEPDIGEQEWLTDSGEILQELVVGDVLVLWFRSTHDGDTPVGHNKNFVTFSLQQEGSAVGNVICAGGCWAADASLECYRVYKATDEETAGGEWVSDHASLPFDVPCVPPEEGERTDWFRVTKRNKYGLESLEALLNKQVIVNADGEQVNDVPATPSAVLSNIGGGKIQVDAEWSRGHGPNASLFRITATPNDGTTPESIDVLFDPTPSSVYSALELMGPFRWGSTVSVEVSVVGVETSRTFTGYIMVNTTTPTLSGVAVANTKLYDVSGVPYVEVTPSTENSPDPEAEPAVTLKSGPNGLSVVYDGDVVFQYAYLDGTSLLLAGNLSTFPYGTIPAVGFADGVHLVNGDLLLVLFEQVVACWLSDSSLGSLQIGVNQVEELTEECPCPDFAYFTPDTVYIQFFDVMQSRWRSLVSMTSIGLARYNTLLLPEG